MSGSAAERCSLIKSIALSADMPCAIKIAAPAPRHAAMTSMSAMNITFPAVMNDIQRRIHAARQCPKRNRNQWVVKSAKPEILNIQITKMRLGAAREAHADHQTHIQSAQDIVILAAWRGANKQVISDLRKVHS